MRNKFIAVMALGFLLMFQGASQAAPPVQGFLGAPWGAGRPQVETLMAEQGFVKLPRPDACSTMPEADYCRPTEARYDGMFAGERAEVRFSFQNKELFQGSAILQSASSTSLVDQVNAFTRMKTLLSEKYGAPATDTKWFRPNRGGEGARAAWSLTAGESGDQVEIIVAMEGVFTYTIVSPGSVRVHYINRSLERRLKNSHI